MATSLWEQLEGRGRQTLGRGGSAFLLCIGLVLLSACEQKRCPSDPSIRGFGDTPFLRACSSDELLLGVSSNVLYPSTVSNVGGAGGASPDSVEVSIGISSYEQHPREAFHADVHLCSGADLVNIEATGESCQRLSRSKVRCRTGVNGVSHFELQHAQVGAGDLVLVTPHEPSPDSNDAEKESNDAEKESNDAEKESNERLDPCALWKNGELERVQIAEVKVKQPLPEHAQVRFRKSYLDVRERASVISCDAESSTCGGFDAIPVQIEFSQEQSRTESRPQYVIGIELLVDAGRAFLSAKDDCDPQSQDSNLELPIGQEKTSATGYLCVSADPFRGELRSSLAEENVTVSLPGRRYLVTSDLGAGGAESVARTAQLKSCGEGTLATLVINSESDATQITWGEQTLLCKETEK